MALTVLLGGARSGKSSLAVDLGRRHEAAAGRAVALHDPADLLTATASPVVDPPHRGTR